MGANAGGLAFRKATPFSQPMLIAWTTVSTPQEAETLAAATVERGLSACVQISGIVSHYRWDGRMERAEELRLTFKCLEAQLPALEAFVLDAHPYEVAEWIVVRTERVSEKYLSWAEANSTNQPL
jgi:periplasmic divalent cation tolerance protein